MYKLQTTVQLAFEDFNQPIGLKMNPSNRWIQKAELIPFENICEVRTPNGFEPL